MVLINFILWFIKVNIDSVGVSKNINVIKLPNLPFNLVGFVDWPKCHEFHAPTHAPML